MTTKIIQVWKVNLRMKAQGFWEFVDTSNAPIGELAEDVAQLWEFVDTSNAPIGELAEDVAQLADCFPGHSYRAITRTPIHKTNYAGVRVFEPESQVRQRIDVVVPPVIAVEFTVSKPKF